VPVLPSLADLEELSARLGLTLESGSADALRAQAALDDASALIRAEAGAGFTDWDIVPDSGDSGPNPIPDIITAIALAAAYRAYQNPQGATSAQVGDVSVSYGGTAGGGSVYLTRDERNAIRRAAGRSSTGSLALTSDYLLPRDPLLADVNIGGDQIPLGPAPWEE
jgi:hypothetical protein